MCPTSPIGGSRRERLTMYGGSVAKLPFGGKIRKSGSVIQVMLCSRSHGIVGQKYLPRSGRQQSAMMVREACPACGAERYKRNGHMHTPTVSLDVISLVASS